MTAAAPYSASITNDMANPPVRNSLANQGARRKGITAHAVVAAADADGDIYYLCRVHSSWSLKHIWLYNDAIADGTDYNLGLYAWDATSRAPGADVDENLYGDAISMASARTTAPIDALYEILNITAANKPIWEQLGLSADPNVYYVLALTAVTVGTAAGDIMVDVEFCEEA